MLRRKAECQTNSNMRKYCFLHLTPDWSTAGGFCSFTRFFVLSVFLSFLEWAIPIFESSTHSPCSSFHLYWVGQWAKGYAPFLFPWDTHSPREETWPRENCGYSELYFWGSQQFSQLHCELCLGRDPWRNVFIDGEYQCLQFLPDTLFPGWPSTSSSSCHQSLDLFISLSLTKEVS